VGKPVNAYAGLSALDEDYGPGNPLGKIENAAAVG
jgi:hypothetical protein